LFHAIDWRQDRLDRTLSGVEIDREYDPSALIEEFSWVARKSAACLDGTMHGIF
jgi:hypothetical protein